MILSVGEILYDIFADRRALGGAPFNVWCHLRKLGCPALFASRVGDDEPGRRILSKLAAMGLSAEHVQVDRKMETGYVRVGLDDFGVPDFTIAQDVAYDHLAAEMTLLRLVEGDVAMIYYGTLGQRGTVSGRTVGKILSASGPGAKKFCDLNLRKDCFTEETVLFSVAGADILKVSEEEFSFLREMIPCAGSMEDYARFIMEKFGLEWLAVTMGAAGSVLFADRLHRAPSREAALHVVDTVGAGDGYSAVLMAGYLLGWPPEKTLARADLFAGDLCGVGGAVAESPAFYDKYSGWIRE